MRIKNLFTGIVALLIISFIFSLTVFKTASLDIQLYDTYYIVGCAYVSLFILIVSNINLLLYKLKSHQPGILNKWFCIFPIIFFLFFFTILCFVWVNQEKLDYSQSGLLPWAFLSFIISEFLILLYFFLPGKRVA